MRRLFAASTLLISGCGLLRPDYDPCPADGSPAPVPGPVIEPVSVGAGDQANGERYRKLKDGTVCVCGTYEIGCHETPEGADSSMSCGYNAQGQKECEPYVAPPDPGFAWNNETGQDEALGSWVCPYRQIDRQTKKAFSYTRNQSASDYQSANALHFDWCDNMSDAYTYYACSACRK